MTLRRATPEDAPAIEALIAVSSRGLGRAEYSAEQIEGALEGAFGVDRALIEDGTSFVVEEKGELLACGSWSRRATLFGSDAVRERRGGWPRGAVFRPDDGASADSRVLRTSEPRTSETRDQAAGSL